MTTWFRSQRSFIWIEMSARARPRSLQPAVQLPRLSVAFSGQR
jgi:hypothetical protein